MCALRRLLIDARLLRGSGPSLHQTCRGWRARIDPGIGLWAQSDGLLQRRTFAAGRAAAVETTTRHDTRHSHVKSRQLGATNYVAMHMRPHIDFACPQTSRAKTVTHRESPTLQLSPAGTMHTAPAAHPSRPCARQPVMAQSQG